MSDLDQVLEGTEVATGEQVAEQATETSSPEVQASEETQGEAQAEPVVNWEEKARELERQTEGLKSAAAAERHKRQLLEQQYRQTAEKPDFWEDPEGLLAQRDQAIRQEMRSQFLNMSENMARSQFGDYDEMRDKFLAMAEQNPALGAQMHRAENPALFAYETAKKTMQLDQFGSFEQAVEQEVQARLKKQQNDFQAKANAIPGSITEIRGSAVQSTSYSGPPSLDKLIGE